MRLSLAADDLFIVPPKWFFVKPYFLEAFELSELGHSRSFSEQTGTFSASIGSFQGLPAEASEVILLPQRLALKYNTTPPPPCQHFLTDFFNFFAISFGGEKVPQSERPFSVIAAHTCVSAAGALLYIIIHYIVPWRRALFMILTVNIGNTHITVGGYEQDTLRFCGRLHSDMDATVDEYAIRLVNLLSLHGATPDQIEGGILGSVVPVLSGRVLSALHILCKARILTVGPGLKSGIKLRLDNPAQLGAELLCGAVAALSECSGPLVVISADTAISMMAVNAKQELVGGVILPGPQLSLSALVKNTAQLPQIDLAAKAPASILGKSTSSCLQNGFVLGTASLLDGLAERFCAELGPQTAFYATGSLPAAIREACRTPILYRETLITDGLYRIWMKNKKG